MGLKYSLRSNTYTVIYDYLVCCSFGFTISEVGYRQ